MVRNLIFNSPDLCNVKIIGNSYVQDCNGGYNAFTDYNIFNFTEKSDLPFLFAVYPCLELSDNVCLNFDDNKYCVFGYDVPAVKLNDIAAVYVVSKNNIYRDYVCDCIIGHDDKISEINNMWPVNTDLQYVSASDCLLYASGNFKYGIDSLHIVKQKIIDTKANMNKFDNNCLFNSSNFTIVNSGFVKELFTTEFMCSFLYFFQCLFLVILLYSLFILFFILIFPFLSFYLDFWFDNIVHH